MKAVAIELDALGDTRLLWQDWLDDAERRFRIDADDLNEQLPNWRPLLERFAEERAPVYLRPDAQVSSALRRLHGAGTEIGIFTEVPAELARVALAQLGASRRIVALETGEGALERLRSRLGPEASVVRTRADLVGLR
jgi:phosphoglycolate phosphatase-like HAD superfamily hydrolase